MAKNFVSILKGNRNICLRKKEVILSFVLCTLKYRLWLDSNPRPSGSQSYPFSLHKNFQIFLREILRHFSDLSVAESPVESNNNRQFPSKRQKTRIFNNFWPRSNFCMKLSRMYEEVHKLSYFARISHEAVVHPKSEVHILYAWISCVCMYLFLQTLLLL